MYYDSYFPDDHVKGCVYKSISEIYSDDRGLNLVTPGNLLGHGIFYTMPDAILCGVYKSMGSIHYLDTVSLDAKANGLLNYSYRQIYKGFEKPFIFKRDGSLR